MAILLKKFILAVLLVAFFAGNIQAAHIVGGEITYECLGSGTYRFTMKVYRDCSSDGAQFDPVAAITIYRSDDFNTPYINLDVPLLNQSNIVPELDPCLQFPPNVCVQEGIYITGTINLPVSNFSYHISYQRCCRNNTIANIIDPGGTGATYTVELSPTAQTFCNNSPTFNEFPPIVICGNEPLIFDHSATDPEGDLLVYSLCSPLDGGGIFGTQINPGDASAFNGVQPDPAAPPPYDDVNFSAPNFSPLTPMIGDPTVTIDPITGLMTGTPTLLGQFVVGVCVEEYRNGVLLSVIRRDFQFNVAFCQPLVRAQIASDSIVDGQEFIINSCGEFTVDLVNESVQQQNIFEFFWVFNISGTPETLTVWDPTITFPAIGTYQGQLILNPGTPCGDTADISINIFPEINADFSFIYDTCLVSPVAFTDLSVSGSGILTNWNWDFADGNQSDVQNPSHLFAFAGPKDVHLTVRDINNCEDDTIQTIIWYPVPPEPVVQPSRFIGCEPLDVTFTNLSFPVDSTYDIKWDFGDGNMSDEVSPDHTYTSPGLYDVSLEITSPIGCFTSGFYPNWITVQESPIAGFSYTPQQLSSFNRVAQFTDESQLAAFWQWEFDNAGISFDQNPTYTFPDTGMYTVLQIVTHPNGCKDTAIALIDIVPKITYFLPNAFTPNGDGKNESFRPVGFFSGITNYQFTIWNRWGEQIFITNNPEEGWNGRKRNEGNLSPIGVYVYLVSFVGPRGQPYTYKGHATLIR